MPRATQQPPDTEEPPDEANNDNNAYNPAAPAFEPQQPVYGAVYYGQNTFDEQQLSEQFQHGMKLVCTISVSCCVY